MRRRIINVPVQVTMVFALALTVFLSLTQETPGASAQGGAFPAAEGPKVVPSAYNGDVRNLPKVPSAPWFNRIMPDPLKPLTLSGGILPRSVYAPLAPMPGPIQNFAGMNFNDSCTGGQCGGGWPPDPNGDVGLNYYIEAVNDAYAIYDKAGNRLAWFTENQLWANAGTTRCTGNAQGDPVVVYDQMADRWILTNLAFATSTTGSPTAPFYECIAVSQTSDPIAGGWWRYAIQVDNVAGIPAGTLNDYPKFGLWPDCIYMGANGFGFPRGRFTGTEYWSFSRSDMEKGAALTSAAVWVSSSTNSEAFSAIPSNLRGNTPAALPAVGTPNYFVYQSNGFYRFGIYKFTAGANCGATGSSLAGPTNVTELNTWLAPGINDVPQPGPSPTLDNLGYRLMQKVQYRKVGSAESLWINHTANDNPTNVYWAQLDVTGGTIAANPVQQGIHAPDATLWRWMGSIAADNAGNAALGYSTSNGSAPNYPSIQYAGRLATDPLGQLPQSEMTLVAGTGSQTTFSRWGDYSAMSVDPADDCTFWYTNEYYIATGTNWNNRIGSFRFPIANCTDSPVSVTPHTVIFDGGVGSSWKLTTERLGTMPTTGTFFDYYATWDANNLYFGIKGSAEGNYTYVAVVDRDVANETSSNTGSTAALACAGGFNANGKGDFAVVRTGGTMSTVGSTSKQQGSSGAWAAWNPSANTDAKDWGRNMAAFQVSWADIALPPPNSAVGLYLYVCNGASLVSAWPPEDRQSASPILNVVTLFSGNANGATPRLQAKHKKDETIVITNGGPFSALNGYVQLANVKGLSASCSFDASVSGNTDFNDPQIIHRQYTLTPGSGCGGLIADLTLQYEDGTTTDNAPSEIGTLVETTLHVLRLDAGVWTDLGGTVNAAANTETVPGVSQFSTFTLGSGAHPTAVRLSSFSASANPASGIWRVALAGMIIVAGSVVIVIRRRW